MNNNNNSKILFWRTKEKPYGCFSNFANFPTAINGKLYPTNEHWYQSQKFEDVSLQEQIRAQPTPRMAKDLAKSFSSFRPDWESVKMAVMLQGLMAKARQHEEFKNALISTGNKEICENSPYDYIWGIGADGTGLNLLGRALMAVRDMLEGGSPFYNDQ